MRRSRELAKARSARAKINATVIAVTGSSAKSTTTALISEILATAAPVASLYFSNTPGAIARFMAKLPADDRNAAYVVVEAGAGFPGGMAHIASVVAPDIAVATLVSLDHYSAFRSREAISREKGILFESIRSGGFAVINRDDDWVVAMAGRTKQRQVTFGRHPQAMYRVTAVSQTIPGPLQIEIVCGSEVWRLTSKLAGQRHWLPLVAAFATAAELGINKEEIKRAIGEFAPLACRCETVEVKDGPYFIVDTAKAPWDTLPSTIEILKEVNAPRKRVVIGQISDYAGASRPKYRGAYRMARALADQVIFVGDNCHRSGASDADRAAGRIVELPTVREVHDYIRRTAIAGEVILLKSSQKLHLERAALAFIHDVRCWENSCGRKLHCTLCGRYGTDFANHAAIENDFSGP